MRLGIIADIHGNFEALERVLADGVDAGVEEWICLGDVIGYGPDPQLCVKRLVELGARCLRGNHEARLLGLSTGPFNANAEAAIEYSARTLDAEDRAALRGFQTEIQLGDDALFCHGSPAHRDEYLLLRSQLTSLHRDQQVHVVFFGHTHQQLCFDGVEIHDGAGEFQLETSQKLLVNPGSVGQPRDGDPRAGYAIVDFADNYLCLRRVEYDVERQAQRTLDVGLPPFLAERLLVGR